MSVTTVDGVVPTSFDGEAAGASIAADRFACVSTLWRRGVMGEAGGVSCGRTQPQSNPIEKNAEPLLFVSDGRSAGSLESKMLGRDENSTLHAESLCQSCCRKPWHVATIPAADQVATIRAVLLCVNSNLDRTWRTRNHKIAHP